MCKRQMSRQLNPRLSCPRMKTTPFRKEGTGDAIFPGQSRPKPEERETSADCIDAFPRS